MKKRLYLFAFVALLAVSCNGGESPEMKNAPFKLNGIGYATLQEAVDAAFETDATSVSTITIVADASGSGVDLEAEGKEIVFDFLNHTYNLVEGGCFNLANNPVFLTADGGGIECSGTSPAIKGEDGLITVSGNFNVNGENILETSSEVYVDGDFRGSLIGDVALDGTQMIVFSSNCKIEIPTLTVSGEDAFFSVDPGDNASNAIVKIDKVISDQKNPVVSVDDKSVKVTDGTVHVHNFSEVIEKGSCVTPSRRVQVCSDCGYERFLEYIEDEVVGCDSKNFVHFDAQEANSLSYGNIEFWQCPLCGKYYSDPEGKHELAGSPYVFPEVLSQAKGLMHQFDGDLDWTKEFPEYSQTNDPGTIASIIGTLATFGFSIASIVDGNKQWHKVNTKLNDMKVQLNQIDNNINKLIDMVSKLTSAEPIRARNKYINFIKPNTQNAFNVIDSILLSSMPDDKKMAEIKNVVTDWASELGPENTQPHNLTRILMREFYSVDKVTGLTVTQMNSQLVNGATSWEHDGYNMRYQMLITDLFTVGYSYVLSGIYMQEIADYKSKQYKEAQIRSLQSEFDQYKKEMIKELELIKYRDDNFRHLNLKNLTYDRNVSNVYYFFGWFKKNYKNYRFPRKNQDGAAVKSCEVILKDMGLSDKSYITSEQARFIYGLYNDKISDAKKKVSLYVLLADSVKFNRCPRSNDPDLIFAQNNGGFGHEKDEDAVPVYKIFHWESYRNGHNKDYFGIRSCLNSVGNEENHNILYKCDINSYSKGNIQNLGEETKWLMQTIFISTKKPTPVYAD